MKKTPICRRDFLRTVSLAVAGVSISAQFRRESRRPNIILILADDISAKEFPTYKTPNPTYGDAPCSTPIFEEMVQNGVQFKHAWATPLCHPSRGMIMTGRYAHRTQWWSNEFSPGEGEQGRPLHDSHLTIGQIAKSAGYMTQFVGKWQLDGTRRGYRFDEYVMTPGPAAARSPVDKKVMSEGKGKPSFYWNPGYALYDHPDFPASQEDGGASFQTAWTDYAADIELKFIKDFMRRNVKEGQPFFTYWPAHMGHPNWDFVNDQMGYPGVPPMDGARYPGAEYIEHRGPDGAVVKKTKAGMNYHVQYLDYCLGELIEEARGLGIEDNIVFILSTDNATTEYGKGLKGAVKEHGPKVPMLLYGPGWIKSLGEVDDLASLADVAPTIAELTKAPLPDSYEFDGKSLVPFVSSETERHRDFIYSYNAEYRFVRTRRVLRDGMGFFWDTRGTRNQESYELIDEEAVPRELQEDVDLIKRVLEEYPGAPNSGVMYERYMKEKAGKWESWNKMRDRVLKEYGKN